MKNLSFNMYLKENKDGLFSVLEFRLVNKNSKQYVVEFLLAKPKQPHQCCGRLVFKENEDIASHGHCNAYVVSKKGKKHTVLSFGKDGMLGYQYHLPTNKEVEEILSNEELEELREIGKSFLDFSLREGIEEKRKVEEEYCASIKKERENEKAQEASERERVILEVLVPEAQKGLLSFLEFIKNEINSRNDRDSLYFYVGNLRLEVGYRGELTLLFKKLFPSLEIREDSNFDGCTFDAEYIFPSEGVKLSLNGENYEDNTDAEIISL